jgi:hypothetical protein
VVVGVHHGHGPRHGGSRRRGAAGVVGVGARVVVDGVRGARPPRPPRHGLALPSRLRPVRLPVPGVATAAVVGRKKRKVRGDGGEEKRVGKPSARARKSRCKSSPCSLGLSATSQQYFSLRTNQPPAIS